MKRFAIAGTFALIGGAAGLVLLTSILYSCQQGGTPHQTPYNSEGETSTPHSSSSINTMDPGALHPAPASPPSSAIGLTIHPA